MCFECNSGHVMSFLRNLKGVFSGLQGKPLIRVNQIQKNHEEFQYEGQNPGYQTETEKSIENNI